MNAPRELGRPTQELVRSEQASQRSAGPAAQSTGLQMREETVLYKDETSTLWYNRVPVLAICYTPGEKNDQEKPIII